MPKIPAVFLVDFPMLQLICMFVGFKLSQKYRFIIFAQIFAKLPQIVKICVLKQFLGYNLKSQKGEKAVAEENQAGIFTFFNATAYFHVFIQLLYIL